MEWNIETANQETDAGVFINDGEYLHEYAIDDKTAAICHCLLLLFDAIRSEKHNDN